MLQETHSKPCSENNKRVSEVAEGVRDNANTGQYPIVSATCCPVVPLDELADSVLVVSRPEMRVAGRVLCARVYNMHIRIFVRRIKSGQETSRS